MPIVLTTDDSNLTQTRYKRKAMNLQLTIVTSILLILAPPLHGQRLTSGKPPTYPLAAKAAGIDGPVVLKATISKEGQVQNVSVVSGPDELRQAAINAVQAWTYKPYTHFGHTVEVDTPITVNFDMGTGKKKAEEQAKAQANLSKIAQGTEGATPSSTAKSASSQSPVPQQ